MVELIIYWQAEKNLSKITQFMFLNAWTHAAPRAPFPPYTRTLLDIIIIFFPVSRKYPEIINLISLTLDHAFLLHDVMGLRWDDYF